MTDSTLTRAETLALERATEPTITRIVQGYAIFDTPERPLDSLLATVALGLRNLPRGWEIGSHVSDSAPVAAWNAAYWNWKVKDSTHDAVVLLFDRPTAERLRLDPPAPATDNGSATVGPTLRRILQTVPPDQLIRTLEREGGPESAGRMMCLFTTWEAMNQGASLAEALRRAEKAGRTVTASVDVKAMWIGSAIVARTDPVAKAHLRALLADIPTTAPATLGQPDAEKGEN